MEMNIEKRNGERGVVIREDRWGVEVLTTRNGYQWSGMPMDEELIDMLQEAIAEFKAVRANAALRGGEAVLLESTVMQQTEG